MRALVALAGRTRATQCLDCGKCTPQCPVAQRLPGFSPRRLIAETLAGDGRSALFACLACGACEIRCPSAVRFVEFVRDARPAEGRPAPCAHAGAFAAAGRFPATRSRLNWVTPDLRVRESGDVLYFVGCAPLFDAFFGYLGVETLNAVRATVRVLNALGVEPAVLADEVCCGHDQLWSGDRETFRTLAGRNVELIRAAGARTVVTACAECARCLGRDYPEMLGETPFETMHVSRWVADRLGTAPVTLSAVNRPFTFQDPCRLARHLGETSAPREVLARVPGLALLEMAHSGADALCCGTEGFSQCGAVSKSIQVARLEEAVATGAQTLLTACPKCLVHLSCAGRDPEVRQPIEIRDLTEILAEALNGRTASQEVSP